MLASAVQRYKAEFGLTRAPLGAQMHALAWGCCLLCEQMEYGAVEGDSGDVLLEHARETMVLWKCKVSLVCA